MAARLRCSLLVVVLIGNVGGGLNDPYRFPGPFRWGTDTNSVSQEARTVAERLSAQSGHVRVVTDAYTALQLAAYGGMDVAAPSAGLPGLGPDPDRPATRPASLARMLYDLALSVPGRRRPDRRSNRPSTAPTTAPTTRCVGEATPQANLDRLTTARGRIW